MPERPSSNRPNAIILWVVAGVCFAFSWLMHERRDPLATAVVKQRLRREFHGDTATRRAHGRYLEYSLSDRIATLEGELRVLDQQVFWSRCAGVLLVVVGGVVWLSDSGRRGARMYDRSKRNDEPVVILPPDEGSTERPTFESES